MMVNWKKHALGVGVGIITIFPCIAEAKMEIMRCLLNAPLMVALGVNFASASACETAPSIIYPLVFGKTDDYGAGAKCQDFGFFLGTFWL